MIALIGFIVWLHYLQLSYKQTSLFYKLYILFVCL